MKREHNKLEDGLPETKTFFLSEIRDLFCFLINPARPSLDILLFNLFFHFKIFFQFLKVVPVPAVFTRGRWECIDYKDGASAGAGPVSFSIGGDNQTIEFDKSSASQTPLATQTNVHVGEGVGAGQQQIGGFFLIIC